MRVPTGKILQKPLRPIPGVLLSAHTKGLVTAHSAEEGGGRKDILWEGGGGHGLGCGYTSAGQERGGLRLNTACWWMGNECHVISGDKLLGNRGTELQGFRVRRVSRHPRPA